MDQLIKSHKIKIQALTYQSNNKAHHCIIIKLTQLLVSVSLFSFIVTPSTFLAFIHNFNFYLFSTFPLQLFTHTIDKNCMFLLCNGLVVFVGIITRSFSGPNAGVDGPSKYVEDDGSQYECSDVEANEPIMLLEEKIGELDEQNNELAHEAIEIKYSVKEIEEEEEKIEYVVLEDEGEKSGILILKEEEPEIDEFMVGENIVEGEEVVVEEENFVLSTEELNKKFDDFIRRMKEDLRIEARRQLVMV